MTLATEIAADSPLIYLPFDGNFNDSSGNGRNLAAVGSPVLSSANACNSTGGQGVGSITVANYATQAAYTAGYPAAGADSSIEFWVRISARSAGPSARALFGQYGSTNGWIMYAMDGGGAGVANPLYWRLTGTGGDSLNVAVNCKIPLDDSKHHVVVTYTLSTKTFRYYLDGALVDTVVDGGGITYIASTATKVTVGDRSPGGGFQADGGVKLDDFALYQSVLSLARVQAHYLAGSAASGSGGSSRLALLLS